MITKFKNIFCHFILAVFSLFLITGCVHLNSDYIQQKQYAINVPVPASSAKRTNKVLDIYYPEVAAQFAQANFVYRSSAFNYISDYYTAFFGSPTEQIYQNLIRYLQATKIFKYAADDVFPLKADYVLRTNVTELYADYRNAITPKAVIALHFVLVDVKAEPKIVINKTYRKEIALHEKTPAALVAAWSKGLSDILQQLVSQMGSNLNTNIKIEKNIK